MQIRVTLALLVTVMLFLTAKPVSGDTITVGGKRYENVLVTESPSGKFYYIKLPAEGRVINVSRDEVKAGSVSRLARDSKEYFALRDKYTTARKGGSQASTSTKSPEYSLSRKNPPEQSGLKTELSINGIEALSGHGGVPILTNDPSKYKNRRKAKPVFVTNRGIMVFTNDPEKYRDDRRYVEIALNYERIAVPQKYRVAAAAGTASDLAEIISYYARHYRLDENLVYAVIRCESNFNPNAVSHAGARGLMQLMPGTAAEMGVDDIFDPAQNVAGGTQYLAKMLQLFRGDERLAVAAYNAGPGNVRKYGGIPPFRETQGYVKKVLSTKMAYSRGSEKHRALAKAAKVAKSYIPQSDSAAYLIVYKNGLTQPAEVVVDKGGDYYFAEYQGTSTQVRKEHVKDILAGAA